jgi:hypothetical protein
MTSELLPNGSCRARFSNFCAQIIREFAYNAFGGTPDNAKAATIWGYTEPGKPRHLRSLSPKCKRVAV